MLGEGAAITALLFEAFFVDETQVDVFDAVLVAKGHEELVGRSRPVAPVVTGDDSYDGSPVRRLGRPVKTAVFAPFSLRQIVELIVLLPVNFIPYVGVPLFLIGTGYRAGPLLMWRYYALREMTRKERKAYIRRRRWSYAWYVIGVIYYGHERADTRQVRHRASHTSARSRVEHVLSVVHGSRGCFIRFR